MLALRMVGSRKTSHTGSHTGSLACPNWGPQPPAPRCFPVPAQSLQGRAAEGQAR